jgi:hypothetical protein
MVLGRAIWKSLRLLCLAGTFALTAFNQPTRAQDVSQVFATLPSSMGFVDDGEEADFPKPAGVETGLDRPIPWDKINPRHRNAMASVVENQSFTCQGPVETFLAKPNYYNWLLDHPDSTTALWQKLGAKCVPITSLGDNSFRWRDPDHGQVNWTLVHRESDMRVWYATGKIRPTKLMPQSNIEAVLVARYQTGRNSQDRPAIRHQYQLFLRTDSRATAMAARFLGASLPKIAEQYMGQLQLFFHGMAWLDEEQPRRSQKLVDGIVPPEVLRPVVGMAKPETPQITKPVSAPLANIP